MSRTSRHDSTLVHILVFVIILVFAARGLLVGENSAVKAMEAQGYTEVEVTDHSWLAVGLRGCSVHDAARLTVRAKNSAGETAEMYVCAGWPFKGGTIRVP